MILPPLLFSFGTFFVGYISPEGGLSPSPRPWFKAAVALGETRHEPPIEFLIQCSI